VKTVLCTIFSCCERLKFFSETSANSGQATRVRTKIELNEKRIKYHLMAELLNIMMYLPCEVSCMSATSNVKCALSKGMSFYLSERDCDSSLKLSNWIFIAEC